MGRAWLRLMPPTCDTSNNINEKLLNRYHFAYLVRSKRVLDATKPIDLSETVLQVSASPLRCRGFGLISIKCARHLGFRFDPARVWIT